MKTSKVILVDPASLSTYYNYCYLKSLADQGVDTELLTTRFPYESIRLPDGVKVNYCFFKFDSFLKKWLKLPRLPRVFRFLEYPFNLLSLFIKVLRERPKFVHYIWTPVPVIDLLFLNVLKAIGIKIVFTAHNPFPHDRKPGHKWLYKKIYQTVDHIIVLTNHVKKTIIENTGVGQDRFTVIPHGDYDYIFSHFRPNTQLKLELERAIDGCKVLSFFGGIRPYKGLEYLLQAFSLVKSQIPNVKLYVFGRCMGVDGNFYIDQASRLKLGDSVRFDFRYIPLPDLLAYLDMTHLAVLPYTDASQSGNIAMLYKKGIPVIATDAGGLPEMVVDGKSGMIVPAKDVSALAERIIDILRDEDKRQDMANFAKALAEQEYSWEKIARKAIAEIYQVV